MPEWISTVSIPFSKSVSKNKNISKLEECVSNAFISNLAEFTDTVCNLTEVDCYFMLNINQRNNIKTQAKSVHSHISNLFVLFVLLSSESSYPEYRRQ